MTDGSPAVRLGEGTAGAISPDGEWVAALDTHQQSPRTGFLLPTGAGQKRTFPPGKLDWGNASWMPDSKGMVFLAREPGKAPRVYYLGLDGGEPRPVTLEGYGVGRNSVAPDGKTVVVRRVSDGKRFVWPVSGGESEKELTGFAPNEVMIRWSADGRSVFAFQGANRKTMLITNIDVATGKREVVKEWTAADQAGVLSYSKGGISADGKTIVYSYNRSVGDLYLVDGLK